MEFAIFQSLKLTQISYSTRRDLSMQNQTFCIFDIFKIPWLPPLLRHYFLPEAGVIGFNHPLMKILTPLLRYTKIKWRHSHLHCELYLTKKINFLRIIKELDNRTKR